MSPASVDPAAAEFFRTQQADPANATCCDCAGASAQWASVSHGVYLSIGAAGVHRSLGVRTSFVLSTTMDSWKPVHLRMMELGGNGRFQEFLREHGIAEDMPIRKKYNTRAAEWYRENLRALAEGLPPPPALEPGTGHLPSRTCGGAATAEQEVLNAVFAKAPTSASTEGLSTPSSVTRRRGSKSRSRSLGSSLCGGGGRGGGDRAAQMIRAAATFGDAGSVLFVGSGIGLGCAVEGHLAAAAAAGPKKREQECSGLFGIVMDLHRSMKGHCRAQRLKTMSSGCMPGFGPESCGVTATRRCEVAAVASPQTRSSAEAAGRLAAVAAAGA